MRDNRLREPLAKALQRPLGAWRPLVEAWRRSPQGRALEAFVDARVVDGGIVYPDEPLRALELTPLSRTRVVIVGQDPYHGAGQAEGLAFSVPAGVRPPPSLRNILAEWQRDLGGDPPASGHLGTWAAQGVLLLNTTLTVEDGRPGSHAKRGWEELMHGMVAAAAEEPRPKVFVLWGVHAQELAPRIDVAARHLILRANHPSPLSATRGPDPFDGCGHFSLASSFLAAHHDPDGTLTWHLPPS